MTKKTTLALLAVAGLLGTTTVHAAAYNGDLLVGFTAEVGNDLVYDLGAAATITNGQSWNLNALLTNFDLSTIKWGVIGANNPGTRTVYTTKLDAAPPTITGNSAWAQVNSPISSIYSLFPAAGAGQNIAPSSTLANSWNQQTIAGATPTTYKNAYTSPNVTGLVSNNFYRVLANGSAPTLLGTFSLDSSGVITFKNISTNAPVPPAPVLTLTHSAGTSTISFASATSATYTLRFTNSAGLSAPITTWPSIPTTINGDGTTKQFSDVTTDTNRFYGVSAQ